MLKTWLHHSNQKSRQRAEIAKDIGITPTSLWRIAEGQQLPRPKVAVAIERVTGIPAAYWATEAANKVRESESAAA